jgi:hypothetical protein
LTFASGQTGNQSIYNASGIRANPSGSLLFANVFIGSLSGNATTATTASGATTALIANTTTSGVYYLTFASGQTGNQSIFDTANITVNPADASINAITFIGSLSGNATSSTNATNVGITYTASGVYYMPMSASTSGNNPLLATSGIHINAASGSITANLFIGTFSGSVSSVNTSNVTTGDNYYLPILSNISGTQSLLTTSGVLIDVDNGTIKTNVFIGSLSGNATTATSASGATTALVSATTTSGLYYLTFVSGQIGNQSIYDTANITVNPNTNAISAATFIGSLSGTATTATNANNINMVNTVSGIYYLPIVATVSGNQTLYDTSGITINASGAVLSATTFVGFLSGTSRSTNTVTTSNATTGLFNLAMLSGSTGAQTVYNTTGIYN